MENFIIFSGRSNKSLAESIAARFNAKLGPVLLDSFANGELRVELLESVRNKSVFILQTGYSPYRNEIEKGIKSLPSPNDHLFELLMMVQACKLASAAKVTAIIPCFPYAVESKSNAIIKCRPLHTPNIIIGGLVTSTSESGLSDKSEDVSNQLTKASSGKLVANMLQAVGVSQVITLALHHPQYEGYFDVPADNIPILPLFRDYLKNEFESLSQRVLVSPDIGGAKRVIEMATELTLPFAIINQTQVHGDIKDKDVILIDDIADSCKTISQASSMAKFNGAKSVTALIIHGIFSPSSLSCLVLSPITKIICTNSIEIRGSDFEREAKMRGISIEIIDVSYYLANIIKRHLF